MNNEVKQIKNDKINFDKIDKKSYVKYIETLLYKYEDLNSEIEYCNDLISKLENHSCFYFLNKERDRFFDYQTEIIKNIREAINHSTMSKFFEYVRYGFKN